MKQNGAPVCITPAPTIILTPGKLQCANIDKFGKCKAVETGIGNIDVNPASFVSRVMSLVLGVSGGIAVLLIILAGYRFMTSRGNPEVVQESRERIIAAIVGLLFVIFSLVILEIIGVDILKIPGFEP